MDITGKASPSLRKLVADLGFQNFDCPLCGGQFFRTISAAGEEQRLQCKGQYDAFLKEYKGCSWQGTWQDVAAAKKEPPEPQI